MMEAQTANRTRSVGHRHRRGFITSVCVVVTGGVSGCSMQETPPVGQAQACYSRYRVGPVERCNSVSRSASLMISCSKTSWRIFLPVLSDSFTSAATRS